MNDIFGIDNVFRAWRKFRLGKSRKYEVQEFERHLEDNLFDIAKDLHSGTYRHGRYWHFSVHDGKHRNIFKASVRDRVVHQLVYDYVRVLYIPLFISDSYASQIGKGSHAGVCALARHIRMCGEGKRAVYALRLDVKKYFESVDIDILITLVRRQCADACVFAVIKEIVASFSRAGQKGIPLGNVTSQIFANMYLYELDMFAKKELGMRWYIRYNDDVVICDTNPERLQEMRDTIVEFCISHLRLEIPLKKTSIRKASWGIPFLGYIVLPDCVLLGKKSKQKMFMRARRKNISSYVGILKHCASFHLRNRLLSGLYSVE